MKGRRVETDDEGAGEKPRGIDGNAEGEKEEGRAMTCDGVWGKKEKTKVMVAVKKGKKRGKVMGEGVRNEEKETKDDL